LHHFQVLKMNKESFYALCVVVLKKKNIFCKVLLIRV